MRPITITIGGMPRTPTGRSRQHGVRLYGADTFPLFQGSGKARTPFEADKLARETYSEALEAIFRAQGLTRADAGPSLSVVESEVMASSPQNARRVTRRASHEAEAHPKAERVRLGGPLVSDIVKSVAMTDSDCLTALQHDHPIALGMWLTATGRDRLVDVDSCWLVTTPSGTVRVPHGNNVVRDMLRLLVLRGLSPHHETPGPNGRPFAEKRFDVH